MWARVKGSAVSVEKPSALALNGLTPSVRFRLRHLEDAALLWEADLRLEVNKPDNKHQVNNLTHMKLTNLISDSTLTNLEREKSMMSTFVSPGGTLTFGV